MSLSSADWLITTSSLTLIIAVFLAFGISALGDKSMEEAEFG